MIQLELPLKNTSSTTGFFNYSQGITLDRPERLQLQSRNGTTGPTLAFLHSGNYLDATAVLTFGML